MPHFTTQELLNTVFDKSVHNQILESLEHRKELGNHVDLPTWIGMLFDAVFSRDQRPKEFIVNKQLNMWFEELSYSSATACINIMHGTEGTFAKFNLTSMGLWFHGTTHERVENIRKYGISLIYSHTKTEFGARFYLSPSFFDAKE